MTTLNELLQNDPAMRAALFSFGAQVAAPREHGQNLTSAVTNAASQAFNAYNVGRVLEGKLNKQKSQQDAEELQRRLTDYALGQFYHLPTNIAAPAPGSLPEGATSQQALGLAAAYGGNYGAAMKAFEQPTAKAPTTRTRIDGDQSVVEQFNPQTMKWDEVSRGPRYETGKPPSTRTRISGRESIVEQWNKDKMKWEEISRGPRYGRTEFDLSAGEPGKQERQGAAQAARGMVPVISDMGDVLKATRTAPGAFGIPGAVGEKAAGVVGQVSPLAGEAVSLGITGQTAAEAQAIRTKSSNLVNQLLPVITNDTSGRYSDQDVNRAKEIAGSGWQKSAEQTRAALQSLMQIQIAAYYRNLSVAGLPPEFDLTTDDGINKMGAHLESDLGMDHKAAVDTIRKVMEIYQGMRTTGVQGAQ